MKLDMCDRSDDARPEFAPLLVALGRAGIELSPHPTDPGIIRFRPFGTLTPELAESLRAHKREVLTLLAVPLGAPLAFGLNAREGNGEVEYVMAERLGVADDLGIPTHPGSAAWLVAVGESMESRCHSATLMVEYRHGSTDRCDCGGCEGERSSAGGDCQGRGRGP